MSAPDAIAALDAAARDWHAWLASQSLNDPAAMNAHTVTALVAGSAAPITGTRVYCAFTVAGVAAYVGQTRRPLAARIGEHVRNGNARDWEWVVSVDVSGLSVAATDALERSAHLWMVPHGRRRHRKTPARR